MPATPAASWPVPPALKASAALHAAALAAAVLHPAMAPWALGAVVANHVGLTAAGLWPRSTVLGPNVRRLPEPARARGAINLSFDDGPDPDVTPRVLDALAEAGLRATFFCIAERARAQPLLVRRMVEAGHDVQNHSLRHRHTFSMLGPTALEREITASQQVLHDACGRRPHAFRAPAGLRNPFLDPVLHRHGLRLVSWTRRGFDTRDGASDAVLRRLTDGLAAGDLLLLHDGHAGRDAAGMPHAVSVLPALARALRAAGLHGETLREALPGRA